MGVEYRSSECWCCFMIRNTATSKSLKGYGRQKKIPPHKMIILTEESLISIFQYSCDRFYSNTDPFINDSIIVICTVFQIGDNIYHLFDSLIKFIYMDGGTTFPLYIVFTNSHKQLEFAECILYHFFIPLTYYKYWVI
jgi:hypothetical protein